MKKYKTVLNMVEDISSQAFTMRMFYIFFKKYPISYLGEYQLRCRVYLDEYPEQKEARLTFFMRNWNLKSNQGIRNTG